MNLGQELDRIKMDFLTYDIEGLSIVLPEEHLLPVYQNSHPLYDRLPKHIVKFIPAGSTVIEVGANVGDTLACMLSANIVAKYHCIEGDGFFFEYLELNKAILEKELALTQSDISIEKSFIASQLQYSAFVGSGGTRSGVLFNPDSDGALDKVKTCSLDEYIQRSKITDIKLIMIDVDGFDYDIIESAAKSISKFRPMIYFEFTPLSEATIQNYVHVIKKLRKNSYESFLIFDNFGNFLFDCNDLDLLYQLGRYAHRQNCGLGSRTLYYFDILAVPKRKKELGFSILKSFLEEAQQTKN
jgi:FkbM family methyltransferase